MRRSKEDMGNTKVGDLYLESQVPTNNPSFTGTWVPLRAGRELAQRVNVLHKLLPLFDYVPGDVSPPPAPKHTTAASTKPRAPKTVGIKRASSMLTSPI